MKFGATGAGSVSATLAAGGTDVLLTGALEDVTGPDGTTAITDAAGWRISWTLRLTLRDSTDPARDDVTLENLVVVADATLDGPGSLQAGTTLSGSFGAIDLGAYSQRNVEVVEAAVLDPDGDAFATTGVYTQGPLPFTSNHPEVASTVSSPLAKRYAPCGSSITFPSPNGTAFGLDACSPPYALSSYHLASDAVATFAANAIGPDMQVAVRLEGVLQPDAITPASGAGWGLQMLIRVAEVDDDNGEMILIDAPISIAFPSLVGGKATLTTSLSAQLALLGLSPFETAQITFLNESPVVSDPSGNHFVQLGLRAQQ
jgi:hypothetical protein